MKRLLCLLLMLVIPFTAVCAENIPEATTSATADINTRKIAYAKSSADIFMDSLDDVMREELVRSVVSENDEIILAKMLYGEDRENPTYMRAAIIWCVFNRMDAGHSSISEVVTHERFPGYMSGNPVKRWAVELIWDVTIRYVLELNGFTSVGRVLPREYLYYEQPEGKRYHVFKTGPKLSNSIHWDWSLPSPYVSDK